MLFEIAVRSPLRRLFTYESDSPLPKGVRVRVPFGSREITGFVWKEAHTKPEGLKKIAAVLDEHPLFEERTLDFFERSAQYYAISLGDLLSSALPKAVREGKEFKIPATKHFVPNLPKLSEAQQAVYEIMARAKGFQTHLLLGETGSGKTEIYLHLMESILEQDAQVLFLVPEISLTPQLEDRLTERLGAKVTVFHSQQTEKKREEAFARALSGQCDVFLGARSALLLPFKNLKLIVVDEEHDGSYKQFERGPYHARDLALLRAKLFQIPVILGSATPSLESFVRAQEGETTLHRLPKFFKSEPVEFKVVDLKKTWAKEGRSFFTEEVYSSIEQTLSSGEQALLFLNRRGSASQRVCTACGHADTCKHCSVTLTIHTDLQRAVCHWCGFQSPLDRKCTACNATEFFYGGIGTKEVEAQAKQRFPEARIARLDRDEASKKNNLANTLRDFAAGKIDILVGTQMISKGIDIPKLSLVAILLADQGWGIPDFRAMERSFQLLKQLQGRAGRRGQRSKIVVQTFNPDHPIFRWVQSESAYDHFSTEELKIRRDVGLPPYSRLALLTFSHKDMARVESEISSFVRRIQKFADSLNIQIMGPSPAPVSRWKGVFRHQILFKAPMRGHLTAFLTGVLDELERHPIKSKTKIDRDPYQFM